MTILDQLISTAQDAHDPLDLAFQMSQDEAERVVIAVLHTLHRLSEPTQAEIDKILKKEI